MAGEAITLLSAPVKSFFHKDGEWARDADGDGLYEVHTNTIEGVWRTVRNFLRPFRGVHKKFSLVTSQSVSSS